MTCSICKAQNHTARTCPDKKCNNCGSFLHDHPDGVCPTEKYECPHIPAHRTALGKCLFNETTKCTICKAQTNHTARTCPNKKCSICNAPDHTARTCPNKKCDNCGSFMRDHPDGVCPLEKYDCPHTPLHRIAFGKCVILKCTICKAQNHTAATCPDKKCDNCGSFLRDHPNGLCPLEKYDCPHIPTYTQDSPWEMFIK